MRQTFQTLVFHRVERIRCSQLVLVSLNARHCDWLFWSARLVCAMKTAVSVFFEFAQRPILLLLLWIFSSPLLLCLPAAVSARDPGRRVEHHGTGRFFRLFRCHLWQRYERIESNIMTHSIGAPLRMHF